MHYTFLIVTQLCPNGYVYQYNTTRPLDVYAYIGLIRSRYEVLPDIVTSIHHFDCIKDAFKAQDEGILKDFFYSSEVSDIGMLCKLIHNEDDRFYVINIIAHDNSVTPLGRMDMMRYVFKGTIVDAHNKEFVN